MWSKYAYALQFLLLLAFPFFIKIYDNENETLWRVQQKWYFVWFEAMDNPNSKIEKAVLSWEGSGKRKTYSEKILDLSKKQFIWPIRNYRITLQEKGGTAPEYNFKFSHNAEKWFKRLKTLFFGVCCLATLFAGVAFYVSWPWIISLPILIFILLVLTALITWQLTRHGDPIRSRLKVLSIIAGFSDEFGALLQFIVSNIY